MRTIVSMLIRLAAVLLVGADLRADIPIDVKVSTAMREYCRILEFPQSWIVPKGYYNGMFLHEINDYQFRVVGLLGTRFLVGGIVSQGHRLETILAPNKYQVDLSNPKAPVLPASDETWESATTITPTRQVASARLLTIDQPIEFHGFKFAKSGKFWANQNSLLSPDQAWVVLQSWTGRSDNSEQYGITLDRGFFFGYIGKVFFDVFNADSGKKALTIQGSYHISDPDSVFTNTGWVTERYFIVPMGEHLERCLVCEFGGRGHKQGAKP